MTYLSLKIMFSTAPIASDYKKFRGRFAYKVLLFAKYSVMHYYLGTF